MTNISYTQNVAKRMDKIKKQLEDEDYNDGDKVTWSDVLEYTLRKADMWKLPKKSSKTKSKKKEKVSEEEEFQNEE